MPEPPAPPRPDFTGLLALSPDGTVRGVLEDRLGAEIQFRGEKNDAGYYLQQTNGTRAALYIGELRRVDGVIHGILSRTNTASIKFTAAKADRDYTLIGERGEVPAWARVALLDEPLVDPEDAADADPGV